MPLVREKCGTGRVLSERHAIGIQFLHSLAKSAIYRKIDNFVR